MWPSWLDAAARSARSGASLRNALAEATKSFRRSPIGELLQPFEHALERGATLDAAIAELGGAGPSTTSGSLVVRALRLAARAGGPAASVLDAVASTLHERVALGREVRALSTQARASAVVMVVAPLVFALLAGGADRRVIAFFSSSAGVVCIVAGVVLDALGALWMTRIVRAAR